MAKFVDAKERHVFVLAGDRIAQSGCIPEFPTDGLADSAAGHALAFDTTNPGRWDTGLVELLGMRSTATTFGLALDATAVPKSARELSSLLPEELAKTEPPPWQAFRPLHWLGGKTIDMLSESGAVSELLVTTAHGAALALLAQARVRAVDLLANIRDAGARRIGDRGPGQLPDWRHSRILAFVGALQLRKFAADIFVANLVGLAVVREMAAVMTTIVMAGRTGGAYAARIATMRGNEELDALKVVGIPFADYIVLPSVLALAFAMPILYLYGRLVGMLGGFVVSIMMLNITTRGYMQQTLDAVPLDQLPL